MFYQPETVRAFYDQYGEREWNRLDSSAHARLIYHLHMHFLRPHLGLGMRVLDAGCGAGRYSIAIAQAGSAVTLLDLSPGQLALAREHLSAAGLLDRCEQFLTADVRDLSALPDGAFDMTVCYGSVLNYLFDSAPLALKELTRVTRKGGHVLISVSNRWGVLRFVLANEAIDPHDFFGRPEYWFIPQVVNTGDLPAHPDVRQPPRHFYTSDELRALLVGAGLHDVELGTAPSFSSMLYARLALTEQNENAWREVLRLEEQAYRKLGLLDTGEFLLAKGIVAGS